MDNKKDMKKEMLIMVVLLLLVITLVGVSYAAFNYSGIGKRANTITTGSITMEYTESSNTINLEGALPTTDKTGMKRLNPGEYFDFTVSSKIVGNVNINYEISAKEIGEGTIDGKYIKLYLTRIKEDGTEEELMVPEVYNEEDTTNEYTGRPNGEMSLYTSSMNSSESNKYRLRMYVDERYNPQDDGGGLTFSVQVNVYGKSGEKYVPLTTQKILEDNELQEEKENMFNYASNGNYLGSNREEQNNPEYVTNGLYSAEDEDGTSYYYRGNIDNNNVQFGQYDSDYYVYTDGRSRYFQTLESCEEYKESLSPSDTCTQVKLASKGDKMYWKIVRINGDGSLRLIYNGTSASPDNSDIENSNVIGSSVYVLYNQTDDSKYIGYTYDRDTNETDSFIKREVDTWYNNTLGSNSLYDSKVILGRYCSDSSGYNYDGNGHFASYDRLAQARNNFTKANVPTLKCPSTFESYGGSYRLKAGLITADELALAGESENIGSNSYLANQGVFNNDFLTMTPADLFSMPNIFAYAYGKMSGHMVAVNAYSVRPVINVKADNGFTSGDGTVNSPYVIS